MQCSSGMHQDQTQIAHRLQPLHQYRCIPSLHRADSFPANLHTAVFHQIDFEVCARNYAEANPSSSGSCIGERNIEEGYVLLYTSGMQTKIIFKKIFVFSFQNHVLYGYRRQRFLKLQKLISESKYTTFDLT